MKDRVEIVHENFITRVKNNDLPDLQGQTDLSKSRLNPEKLVEIFESQLLSRRLDMHARVLQAMGEGFYTIGSSGHEGLAALAEACRLEDNAFLHYRDGAFYIQRSKQRAGETPLWNMLLSFCASENDPISGGRHKVLGSKSLNIPPQTSTIASHLPKAVGAAFSIGLSRKVKVKANFDPRSIIICSFGDASLNHSTAQGAINSAAWAGYRGAAIPILFVCEDNGIGISTRTPHDWVKSNYANNPHIKYFHCNGLNIIDTYETALAAQNYVRREQKPAMLHFECVRLYGHAGADAQHAYMDSADIDAVEANDPLLHSAALLIKNNILSADEILHIYEDTAQRIAAASKHVMREPKLTTAEEVASPLIPPEKPTALKNEIVPVDAQQRAESFGSDFKLMKQPQHMARLINWALHDLMLAQDHIIIAGEDVGPKGGVYNVTAKLHKRFGSRRVINTLLDEQSILGLGIGLAQNNFLPIVEIQFLAYLHNAEDQLRGEAATLSFFSKGQYTNPMIIRIASLPYQRGFGGHFHNDNAITVLRDIPGLIIACPSNGHDAALMMREAVRLANDEQRIIAFLEPIALYMSRDLHDEKDGGWAMDYPAPDSAEKITLGDIHQNGEGTDLCIISYGNGYYLSCKAAKALQKQHGITLRIIDLRWLSPLNMDAIAAAAAPCKSILIVDECRETGSLSEELMTKLYEHISPAPHMKRITATDCFIPLGKAFASTLPSTQSITDAALSLIAKQEKNA
jgi:2-oxoisovalerate dehydrogenase E1 component